MRAVRGEGGGQPWRQYDSNRRGTGVSRGPEAGRRGGVRGVVAREGSEGYNGEGGRGVSGVVVRERGE